MPGSTARGYPYPSATDSYSGLTADLQALATAIDTDVGTLNTRVTATTSQVTATTNGSAIGTSLALVQTLPSATYLANSVYEVWLGGQYQMSVATAFPSFQLRKTNLAGTLISTLGRHVPTGFADLGFHLNIRALFAVGASNVTTALVIAAATSSGTFIHVGAADHPRHVTVTYRGPTTTWGTRTVLS